MNDVLSIFIPTYNRKDDLNRLLNSIILENGADLNNIHIYISSNSPEDYETMRMVLQWKEIYPHISYHTNKKNIGIDANHDKIYDYCTHSKYALAIADDDLLLQGAIKEVMGLCNENFLFALCNAVYYTGGVKHTDKIYNCEQKICLKYKKLLQAMIYQIMPNGMCPLLPFYGGIIVNTQFMNERTTRVERQVFEGTFHQYIGCLWNALSRNEEMCGLISEKIVIAIGHDIKKKSWLSDYQDTFIIKVPSFYKKLELDEKTRKEILDLYNKNILKQK